ncbi:chromosome segregation protein SMC [Thermoanaerobacterium sp. RBIITD]|uniref:chromosome segregation protein SMC n=1 Tax=Thermoanaerobacterium sp. RBIITD TaxID=1550240 RepID=UPI000BB93E8D|nr:chromosome segregation protein SMC [Thermoanaerobacterium sp. RBIITD]SNX55558.1 condensin subunit Smc [Thermoanaerobacterium sp. RBIITD]
MYLKRLEILGFKSFADKVVLNFERGITAIVGPNGSGKSNISDAVRLVLGEQSIKSLRGNKLEDVIFVGTEKRKPLGFAEVNLTLDNSDHTLPLDFTEVVVTRKIYRSGESEFYINKTPCRLKDIYELFMDTGVGKDGYSIISQGKIDEILVARPEDRRQIFEEAAGISKYKYKKEEALKKLAATNDNINRLSDIINELENQLNPLYEQKVDAERYLELIEEKKKVDVTIYANNIDDSLKKLNKYETDYMFVKKEINKVKVEIEKQKRIIEEEESNINELKNSIDVNKENYFKYINEIETINGKIEVLDEKIRNSQDNIDRLKKSINESKVKVNLITKDIENIKNNLENLKAEKKELENNLKNGSEKYEILKKEEDLKIIKIENAKEDIVDILNDIAENKSKLSTSLSMKNNMTEKLLNINKAQESLKKEVAEKDEERIKIDNEINLLNEDITRLYNDKKLSERELNILDDKIEEQVREHTKTLNDFNNTISRLNILKDMEKAYEGYSFSIKNLMKYIENNNNLKINVIGVVGELIKVDSVYSLAIEIALGSAIQDIITKSTDIAKELISILKKYNFGRATFLPLDNINYKPLNLSIDKLDGVVGIASDIIEYDKSIEKAIKFILGKVVIVKDIDTAIMLTKKLKNQFKIVTLNGDVINPGGSITGGSISRKSQNILKRKDDIKNLNDRCLNLKKILKDIDECKLDLNRKREVIDRKIEDIFSNIKKEESQIEEYKKRKSIIEFEIKKLSTIINDNEAEKKQVEESIKNYIDDIKNYENKISDLKAKKTSIDDLIKNYKENQDNNSEKLIELEKMLTDYKVELAKYEQNIQNEIRILNEKQDEYENLIKNIDDMENSLQLYLNSKVMYEDDKKKYINDNEVLNNKLNETKKLIQEYDDLLKQKLIIFKDKKQDLAIIEENHSKQLEKEHKLDINIQKIQMDIENMKNRLWEEYEITLSTAKAYIINENIAILRQRSLRLTKEIRDLGAVNINSIEEYKNIKERYDFLKKQYDDLINARASLNLMIDETNKIIKTKFKDNFKLIEIQFKETFKKLFGGGHAELILTDPDDLLNTGVEINVQPPGKKLQNITLLSGGEKALVAISLLFAMILIRPTPFCILDEIDAALDDANVDRFASYLKELSKDSQFIVVTHRKGTMSVADIMYGVTMQEKGISKLLSLKLESA